MMKFYYSTFTGSTATHVALREAGVDFTPVEVSWQRNVNVDELNKVNPIGAVPAISVDGKPLTQTIAILEYVADKNPKANMLPPPGTWERAEAVSWMAFANADLNRAFGPLFQIRMNRWEIPDAAKTKIKTKVMEQIHKYLNHVDQSLAGKDFIMGKNYTFADSLLFMSVGLAKFSEVDLKAYKNIPGYMKRVVARPAVQQVLKEEGMLEMFQG